MLDADLEIRGGGGEGGGGGSPKKFFPSLQASIWSKNKEGGPDPTGLSLGSATAISQ